ncbi:RNA polymerase sigma-70 factor (sigma-E family) [Nakamurella sp. UYEF19]|uniref:RNA polymerase sigma factor n=1 Tax=Nakamurella sp. UYEF19 TaxID=1756392 RepID=UPI00339168BD
MAKAFDEVVADGLPGLLRYATVLTGHPDRAEDLVQEVLARAFEKWHRISTTDSPNAYLTRMVTNEFLSWRRKLSTRVVVVSPDQIDRTHWHPGEVGTIDDRAELRALLSRLPPRQHAALVLRYYLGYPDAESAAMLGCVQSTVRSLCSRALATLQLPEDDNAAPAPLALRKAPR